MFRIRAIARLVIPVLVATTMQAVVAGEPVGTTPPSNSIREWKTDPTAAPTAQTVVAGEPVGTTPPSNSIREWKTDPTAAPTAQTVAAGDSVGTTPPAQSIREWTTNPIATPTAQTVVAGDSVGTTPQSNSIREWNTNPCGTPPANPVAKPAVSAAVPKSPITISFTSVLRQGNLVVVLDDVPIFNEKFQKSLLLISQTTRWDPLQIAAGKHRLAAKVYGTNKTFFSATYDLNVSRTKASELRFVIHGDKLTVELSS